MRLVHSVMPMPPSTLREAELLSRPPRQCVAGSLAALPTPGAGQLTGEADLASGSAAISRLSGKCQMRFPWIVRTNALRMITGGIIRWGGWWSLGKACGQLCLPSFFHERQREAISSYSRPRQVKAWISIW